MRRGCVVPGIDDYRKLGLPRTILPAPVRNQNRQHTPSQYIGITMFGNDGLLQYYSA